jgi:transcriptional regulator with XRE-family HTH domain
MRETTMAKINKDALRKLREAKGLSQEQLAERAKVNKQTISRLERAEQNKTRAGTIERVARVLSVEPAVLTGDAPVPEVAPPPQMSPSNIELSRQADNALHLVAERYFVRPWQVMELAPLLFCWAAEMSLRRRMERLNDLERACETARTLEGEMRHLPVPNFTYSEEKIAAESESIGSHDIFGGCIDERRFLDSIGPSDIYVDNPFAVFLNSVVSELGDVASFEGFSPIDYPFYRVCPEEASRLVGGDKELTEAILNGAVLLSEMPKELHGLFADNEKRIAWVRAQAKEYHDRLIGDLA